MIAELQPTEAPVSPRGVALTCPAGVPEAVIRLWRVEHGGEPFILVTDADHRLLALLGNGLTDGMRKLIDEAKFLERASQTGELERLLGIGYVMAGHSVAEWMTRHVRLILDMRPHVRRMLGN